LDKATGEKPKADSKK